MFNRKNDAMSYILLSKAKKYINTLANKKN